MSFLFIKLNLPHTDDIQLKLFGDVQKIWNVIDMTAKVQWLDVVRIIGRKNF